MGSDSFLTTEEFLSVFEKCYEWSDSQLKESILNYNFTRAQALYIIRCKDISLKLSDLNKFKEQMKEND